MVKIQLLFIITGILGDGMIVVSNSYLPSFGDGGSTKRGKGKKKKGMLLATTVAGDEARYITGLTASSSKSSGAGSMPFGIIDDDDDSSSDSSSNSDEEFVSYKSKKRPRLAMTSYERPVSSLTGANWQPYFNDRVTMFIAGAPGAGKSYLAKQIIKLLPVSYDILLFTALEENDGNFDELGKSRLYKIKMQPEILSKISLKEIRGRTKEKQVILLFDDVDKIRDSKVQTHVFNIMNDALANGRGHEKHDGGGDIHVICTSHSANDYQKTKYTFENSNYVALFPGATPSLQMHRMFEKLGLDKELCAKMIKLGRMQKIRSIIIHKVVPMYMIFGDKIMLL